MSGIIDKINGELDVATDWLLRGLADIHDGSLPLDEARVGTTMCSAAIRGNSLRLQAAMQAPRIRAFEAKQVEQVPPQDKRLNDRR